MYYSDWPSATTPFATPWSRSRALGGGGRNGEGCSLGIGPPYAEGSELQQHVDAARGVLHDAALGDLKSQPAGLDPTRRQHGGDLADQHRVVEAARGDVHSDAERPADVVPATAGVERHPQHS